MPWQPMTAMKEAFLMLQKCSLFEGVRESELPAVLDCLSARKQSYPRGSGILEMGDGHPRSGVVLEGSVEISLLDETGSQINVTRKKAGESFGMAMACTGVASPIRLHAMTDCAILFLDFSRLLEPETPHSPAELRLASNLLRDLARQTVFLNRRLRIVGQKRLRDKIRIFLQGLPRQPDGTIRLPFNRSEMAEFLSADRSALSRELSRLAEEGILEVSGSLIRVLDPDFLSI